MLLNKIRISVKFILWILYDSFNYKNRCFHKIGYFTKELSRILTFMQEYPAGRRCKAYFCLLGGFEAIWKDI